MSNNGTDKRVYNINVLIERLSLPPYQSVKDILAELETNLSEYPKDPAEWTSEVLNTKDDTIIDSECINPNIPKAMLIIEEMRKWNELFREERIRVSERTKYDDLLKQLKSIFA